MRTSHRGPGTLGTLLAALLLSTGAGAAPPAALRDLRLLDQSAHPLEPASLEGRVLLLNFVFTGCSSTCPLQTHELALLRRSLPEPVRARAEFLSVSVDPVNDTPAALAAFARRAGADQPGWRFATGAPAQVETLLERMQVLDRRRARPAPADHRSSLWLFDREGALVQRFAGEPLDRARLADEIGRLALKSGP